MTTTSNTSRKSIEDAARRRDLAFIRELRTASYARLQQIVLNLSFGGPDWQRIAVRRALERFGVTSDN